MVNLALALLLQTGGGGDRPFAGLDVAPLFTRFDEALGVDGAAVPGWESSLRYGIEGDGWILVNRIFARHWVLDFKRWDDRPVDVDGFAEAGGLELALLFEVAGPLLRVGGTGAIGGFRIRHDFQASDAFLFELGPCARLEPVRGLFLEASLLPAHIQTAFGLQHEWSDHLSWTARLSVGFEVRF